MKRIKLFGNFQPINEEIPWGKVVVGAFGNYLKDVEASAKAIVDKPEKVESPLPTVFPADVSATSPNTEFLNSIPGNDDFILYMQHQQGLSGAKGLLAASAGVGNIHPATLKRKGCFKMGTVPYANLQCNIPSDKPQYKKDIVDALNKGDQRKGASLFLKMWKEKWAEKSKQSKIAIEKPENSAAKAAIQKYCRKYGVPFDFACTVALIESGYNPKSGNTSYKGLYALSESEFKKYVPSGNIYNLDDNANAGIQCLKRNIGEFTKFLGPLLAKVDVGNWAKNLG